MPGPKPLWEMDRDELAEQDELLYSEYEVAEEEGREDRLHHYDAWLEVREEIRKRSLPMPDSICTTCYHILSWHSALGCHSAGCDCRYYSVSKPGLTSLPKRPTKEEALPPNPPKPLTAEELNTEIELLTNRGIAFLAGQIREHIDHWKRRAEEAENKLAYLREEEDRRIEREKWGKP